MINAQRGLPLTYRAEGLLTQQVGPETLVYNEQSHQAFCLNPVAAEVWRQFDGIRTPEKIAEAAAITLGTPVTPEAVRFAIAELRGNGLLLPEPGAVSSPAPSRRQLMRQIGAGAIVMLPAVATIMAPRAAQAYNGCVNCNAEEGTSKVPLPQQRNAVRHPEYDLLPMAVPDSSDPAVRRKREQAGEIFVP